MTKRPESEPPLCEPLAEPAHPAELDRLVSALQDPTRRRILLALVRDGGAHTIDELSRLTGVHRTVAFTHLERLTALGYLERSQRRGRPGKPAALYSVRSGVLAMTFPARQFMALSSVLATGITALGVDGTAASRESGVRIGEQLALRRAHSVAEALLPLGWFGAEYSVAGDEILAGNCIFLEACAGAREVVCGVQAGILEGALRGAGVRVTVEPRGPLPNSGCAYRLRRARRPAPLADQR
ncbi:MAG: MarR family transcriptional regulator [Candidatus Dormibacteria bacterium]